MKRLCLLTVFLALCCADTNRALGAAETHCQKGEETYFSCRVKGGTKIASLCGSPDILSETEGDLSKNWLQYRFGDIKRVAVAFPAKKVGSINRFTSFWSNHKPISAQDTWGFDDDVQFSDGSTSYIIIVARYEDERYGVGVTKGGTHTFLECNGVSASQYGTSGDSNSKFGNLVRALKKLGE